MSDLPTEAASTKCSACRHFEQGEIDLDTMKRASMCKERLHVFAFPGRGGMQLVSAFTPRGANDPICGQFGSLEGGC